MHIHDYMELCVRNYVDVYFFSVNTRRVGVKKEEPHCSSFVFPKVTSSLSNVFAGASAICALSPLHAEAFSPASDV